MDSRYLRLLRRCLTRELFPDARRSMENLHATLPFDANERVTGRDWPTEAETMVGATRLAHLQMCCQSALQQQIPGDFVETGCWRGGCGVLMRAVLEEWGNLFWGDQDRRVWLFDSFEGLPKPDSIRYPDDAGDRLYSYNEYLGVPLTRVQQTFARFELLDHRTQFIKGWFRDTVPGASLGQIAVLRMDGDMYESTMLVLEHFYPKLSPGGYIIVDDYGAIPHCRKAVSDYRNEHLISEPISAVDWTGHFWRKQ